MIQNNIMMNWFGILSTLVIFEIKNILLSSYNYALMIQNNIMMNWFGILSTLVIFKIQDIFAEFIKLCILLWI